MDYLNTILSLQALDRFKSNLLVILFTGVPKSHQNMWFTNPNSTLTFKLW